MDIFGHSASNALLASKSGSDAEFLVRIDYRDFEQRKADQNLEGIWMPDLNIEKEYLNEEIEAEHQIFWWHTSETGYSAYPLNMLCLYPCAEEVQFYDEVETVAA